MRSFWQVLRGTYPSLRTSLQKQIDETEYKLLETKDGLEWATAHAQYLEGKLARLQAHLKCLSSPSD